MSSSGIKYIFSSIIVFLLASSPAAASDKPIEIKFLGVSVKERAERALEYLLGITGIVALLLLIASGIFFTISIGNPDSQKKAKRMLSAVIIGLILVLLSYSFIYFVDNLLTK